VADRERIDGKLEQQKEHIDQAAQKGITSLDIDGGEPLLYPHLFELIGYARAQGFDRINLTTNGRLLIYNSIVKKLACQPGLSVLVSLHAAQAEVHDQLTRVKGSFDQTLEGLKNAQGVIGNLGVNFTIISKNYQQLPFFINLMQKLGIDIVNIQYYTPFGRKENHLTPPEKAIDQVKTALQMAINSNKIRVNLVNFLPCMAPELAQYMGGDYFKESRYMVFVDNRRVNLARFLGEKRYYGEACAQCAYRCTCRGFWDFGEAGQDSAPKKVRYFTAEEEQPIQRQAATDKMFGKPAMGEKCPPIETKTEISAPGVGSQQVNKIEMLDVIMGYQCNSGCIFCSATDSMRSQNMENSEVMARIKPAMKQLSPTKIRFGGGEPTVRNDLPVLLNAVHKTYPCVSEISIQSNGYRLSYPDYLNSLRDAGLNKVNISIRAHTPTLYQQLTRVPNSMELVEKALINVLAKGLPLELDLLVSKPIVIHLEELCEHYFKLGARNINFWHIAFEGKAVQHPHLIPTLKETSDIINQMLDKYTKSDKIFKVYYIPYCFFPDHQDAVWHPIQENTLVITPANNFRLEKGEIDLGVKTSRCRRCAIEDTCFGIRESYLEMFGDKEIQNE